MIPPRFSFGVPMQDHVLSTYDRAISDFTRQEFERCSASLYFHHRHQIQAEALHLWNKLQKHVFLKYIYDRV